VRFFSWSVVNIILFGICSSCASCHMAPCLFHVAALDKTMKAMNTKKMFVSMFSRQAGGGGGGRRQCATRPSRCCVVWPTNSCVRVCPMCCSILFYV
jgi:hypothetical protein